MTAVQASSEAPWLTPGRWRALMILFAVACASLLVWGGAHVDRKMVPGVAGTLGFTWGRPDGENRRTVETMRAQSPLALAGGKVGDRVVFDHPSDRWRNPSISETIGLTLFDGNEARHVQLQPMPAPDVEARPVAVAALMLLEWINAGLWLLLGALLAWRLPASGPLRPLAFVMMTASLVGIEQFLPRSPLQRQTYAVVLMDVQMPEMGGLEAARRIVSHWPNGERPRIVAMTANAMQGDREECIAAGMDDYVTKPIRVDELVASLAATRPRNNA